MFCNKCGSKNPDDSSFCRKCGVAVWSDTSPSPELTQVAPEPVQVAPEPVIARSSTTPLVGVKGWLKFLCISLTIFTPLFTAGAWSQTWVSMSPHFPAIPSLRNALLIDGIASTFLSIFGIYAGYLLWNVKPGAVAIAKIFLLVLFIYSVSAIFGIYAIVDFPEGTKFDSLQDLKSLMKSAMYFSVWFAYLHRAKRVRVTYGSSTFNDWSGYTGIMGSDVFGGVIALFFFGAVVFSNLRY